ncbi:MAG: hypothetical protein KDJ44_09175 [Rhodoblastus sp.]|nr:hypothetical protein [Rhodoblastus sp.]
MIRATLALAVLGAIHLHTARDDGRYAQAPHRDWFRDLKQPGTGVPCCDVSDCRPVEARTVAGKWEAEINNRWVEVPAEKILQSKSNPTGSAVACYWANGESVTWFCFVVPPMI